MKLLEAKRCIRCLYTKATLWSGHVMLDGESITAGWCKPCYAMQQTIAPGSGFVGHYKKKMGTRRFRA